MMMTKQCTACGCKVRVKEPNALGVARRDPLIDIAKEILDKRVQGWPREQAIKRLQMSAPHLLDGRAGVQL